MNTKKNQGGYQNNGGGGGSGYATGYHSNGAGGSGAGGGNYSNAVQNSKNSQQYPGGGGGMSGSGGSSRHGNHNHRGGGSHSYNGGGGGGGGMPQQTYYNNAYHQNGQGYERKGSYAPSASASAIAAQGLQPTSTSNMTFHNSNQNPPPSQPPSQHYGGNNGHHGPPASSYQQLPSSQSFHANGSGMHNKYAPHQSVYEAKGGGNRDKAPPAQVHVEAAATAGGKSLAQPAETQSRILPSPSNTAINRTLSSDSSTTAASVSVKSSSSGQSEQSGIRPKTVVVSAAAATATAVVAPVDPQPVASASSSPSAVLSPKSTLPPAISKVEEAKEPAAVEVTTQPQPSSTPAPVEAVETPVAASPATPVLADLVKERESYEDRHDYYRDLVVAIDRLYPEHKFPLQDTWTFWYIKHDNTQNWLDNIKKVADVAHVEEFWSVFRYLATPSKMSNTTQGDLAFFKQGIQPSWEDKENKSGGGWLHQVPIQQFKQKHMEVDELWKESLLAMIGDNFCGRNARGCPIEESEQVEDDHICGNISGIFVTQRGKQYKLTLWTKNYKDEKTTRFIGRIWKQLLKLSETVTITFEAHETKNSKTANFKIVYKE